MNHVSFGSVLKEARIRKGYELTTVARRLRIRPDILQAIENSDFASMPPSGYTRNMISAYARLLDIDSNEVTRMYLDEVYAYRVGRAYSDIKQKPVTKIATHLQQRRALLQTLLIQKLHRGLEIELLLMLQASIVLVGECTRVAMNYLILSSRATNLKLHMSRIGTPINNCAALADPLLLKANTEISYRVLLQTTRKNPKFLS